MDQTSHRQGQVQPMWVASKVHGLRDSCLTSCATRDGVSLRGQLAGISRREWPSFHFQTTHPLLRLHVMAVRPHVLPIRCKHIPVDWIRQGIDPKSSYQFTRQDGI
ncbi:hypothetical protein RB7939 [Rhodopirellula baltica SH 1]|uniref:Uncharacterized protein n=1 Tax=Rhodopirellula baltica (strain DSM 10527 / NCIMB 13988 / SH1) TaxID=243090 RepID=Q7UMW4_RHOBA|nr:hypothetical protein RB7939 [Rhodopirellula baltica SH 1]